MHRHRIALTLLLLVVSGAHGGAALQNGRARVIEIRAERFEFWPSAVRVNEGEQVELRITSDDTLHGFRIVGGGVSVLVPKRGKGYASVRFTGVRVGRFTFECARMCGAGHHFMRGVLIVSPIRPAGGS